MTTFWHIFLLSLAAAHERGPVAHTPLGAVRGFWVNGSNVWRGIPYAVPPVGELRFRPPKRPPRADGIMDADHFSPSCPQIGSAGTAAEVAWPSINVTVSGEDCLTVNVYAPDRALRGHPVPVIVYFHAGEYRFGSSNDMENDWPHFAEGHAVVVTANVRVGLLGFAALDGLRSRDRHGSSGNYGLQDQRAVLEWVKHSIIHFGGDPDRVTIMGESSGGSSVAFHLTSKASQGLFSQVIMESPGLTQSKPWSHAVDNTKFAISMLTAAGSEGCKWPAGETQWMHYPGLKAKGITGPIAQVDKKEALAICAARPECVVVYNKESSNTSMLFGGGAPGTIANTSKVRLDNETRKHGSNNPYIEVFVKAPDTHSSVRCLEKASIADLVAVAEYPIWGDTVETDVCAPTVDGVELTAPLVQQAIAAVPPNVAVLAGSNLDEGTMFMGSAAQLVCNATEHDLSEWAVKMYGPVIGKKMVQLYGEVEQPTPWCGEPSKGEGHGVSTSAYWLKAMRSVGDSVIVCPLREVLRSARKQGTSKVWWYYFTHTPIYSVNINSTAFPMKLYGAFHGSEVPFVFGDGFELKSDAERALSKAMGCYWINFATTGNPNEGPSGCFKELSLPPWPVFDQDGALEFSTEGPRSRPSLKKDECDLLSDLYPPVEVVPQIPIIL